MKKYSAYSLVSTLQCSLTELLNEETDAAGAQMQMSDGMDPFEDMHRGMTSVLEKPRR